MRTMIVITTELVRQLIDTQFPQWRYLTITPVEKSGHDNRTFHLGSEMTVRLPSHASYAPAVEKEAKWLPVFKPQLSLPILFRSQKANRRRNIPSPGRSINGLRARRLPIPTFAI